MSDQKVLVKVVGGTTGGNASAVNKKANLVSQEHFPPKSLSQSSRGGATQLRSRGHDFE